MVKRIISIISLLTFIFVLFSCSDMVVEGDEIASTIIVSYQMYEGETIIVPTYTRNFELYNQTKDMAFDSIEGNNLDLIEYQYKKGLLSLTALEAFGDKTVEINNIIYKSKNKIYNQNVDIKLTEHKDYSSFEPPLGPVDLYLVGIYDYGGACSFRHSFVDGEEDENLNLIDKREYITSSAISPDYFDNKSEITINDFFIDDLDGVLKIDDKKIRYCMTCNAFEVEYEDYIDFKPTKIVYEEDGINPLYAQLRIMVENVSDYLLVGTTLNFSVTINDEEYLIKRLVYFVKY